MSYYTNWDDEGNPIPVRLYNRGEYTDSALARYYLTTAECQDPRFEGESLRRHGQSFKSQGEADTKARDRLMAVYNRAKRSRLPANRTR